MHAPEGHPHDDAAERWRAQLPVEYLQKRWRYLVKLRVFHNAAEADDRPKLILLGGQPGAGKTRAGDQLVKHGGYGPVTRLIGDDYRRFHPDYRDVLAREPLAMPDVTAQAVGEWLRLAVDHALENRYSILVEGTWRNAGVPMKTIELAAARGYEVHAVGVGVQPEVSRLSTLERYYRDVDQGRQARWTPGVAHEQAVATIPGTAAQIGASAQVHACAVITRAGDQAFVGGAIDGTDAAALLARGAAFSVALREQMEAPLSPEQARVWLRQCDDLHGAHERHTLDNADAQQVWGRILDHDRPRVERASGRSGSTGAVAPPRAPGQVSSALLATVVQPPTPPGPRSRYAPGGPQAPGAGQRKPPPSPGLTR